MTGPLRLRAAPVLSAGVALVAATALWFIDPNTRRIPLCPLHAVTGLWCPFCGCTRAAHALVHADPATALHDNVLFVAALPLLAVLWWRWCRSPGRPVSRLLPRPITWSGVLLVLAFGVVRNLPMGRWLAPPI
jgi:Protein of unknown function (DUF2752)